MKPTSAYLCTFSGKTGDIIWSLPTVRQIGRDMGAKVDFAIMPQYESLLPLLRLQPYISSCCTLPAWRLEGSPYGDQPWEAPVEPGAYSRVWHLTYRYHPVTPLMQHIATAQGVALPLQPLPFLTVDLKGPVDVAYAFNQDWREEKLAFVADLFKAVEAKLHRTLKTVNVGLLPWVQAARAMAGAEVFLGCRSANYVVAHGLARRVLCYEPNPSRRGPVFACPSGEEICPEIGDRQMFVNSLCLWLQ